MRRCRVVDWALPAAALIAAVVCARPAAQAQTIYWAENAGPHEGIRRAQADGTYVENLVLTLEPLGIAIDHARGKMYWTKSAGPDDRIKRANLDGTGVEDLVTTGLAGPRGIAVDSVRRKVYWTDAALNSIHRANLDGSAVENLITSRLDEPWAIDLDVVAGKMYWAASGGIQRANLGGSSIETVVGWLGSHLNRPFGIALDLTNGRVYWTHRGGFSNGMIRRANLDGTAIEDLLVMAGADPLEIALDVAAGKMYWTDYALDEIRRSNLDGSGVETVLSAEVAAPTAIALAWFQCGDGVVDTGEECDDGLYNSDTVPDACRTDCSQAWCGDGVVDTGEECDDGNTESGDGCDESCLSDLGACCVSTACSVMTEADCLDAAGSFFGFSSTCHAPDTDADGLRDECDGCPDDGNKIEPGICGCGLDDSADSDGDGVPDCIDQCPGVDDTIYVPDCIEAIPTVSEWGLVVMTLLLLTGIKIKFGGRRPKRA